METQEHLVNNAEGGGGGCLFFLFLLFGGGGVVSESYLLTLGKPVSLLRTRHGTQIPKYSPAANSRGRADTLLESDTA